MTEDHRITSYSERLRIEETGEPLKDGETRLCGNWQNDFKFCVHC
jgi:protein phosphatase